MHVNDSNIKIASNNEEDVGKYELVFTIETVLKQKVEIYFGLK